jgi:hypothetical protein
MVAEPTRNRESTIHFASGNIRPRHLPLSAGLLAIGLVLGAIGIQTAHGDGGTVRVSSIVGPYRISAFTSPTPLRAGPVDFSVMVQDAAHGEPIHDLSVALTVTSADEPPCVMQLEATRAAATNKLMRSAKFDLPRSGRWRVDIAVDGPGGAARSSFDFVADDPLPQWEGIWLWIVFPVLPIALYTLAEIRRRRRDGFSSVTSGHPRH